MSFIEKRQEDRPSKGEAPFGYDEVFFSRTDDRGVILAANYVFRRVSNYPWDELLGAPHKIIRHPDMPKGVFWLLWDRLKSGEVMGAYVKNRARDGLHYWVFAVTMPCEGGYLSARIKPSGAIFKAIQSEYETLLDAEKTQGLSPHESADLLLERLQTLGYGSYSEFCARALAEELTGRALARDLSPDRKIRTAEALLADATGLTEETLGLVKEFESMRTIPHNMRVIASRLEPTGGPISTLSQNYSGMSQEISDWFDNNVNGENSSFATITDSIHASMFLDGMAGILTETAIQLDRERRGLGDLDLSKERATLNTLKSSYLAKSKTGLGRVTEEANKILMACHIMRRQVLGLNTTSVMCKIEGARVANQGEGLGDIIVQLDLFQSRITARLDRIANLAERIHMA